MFFKPNLTAVFLGFSYFVHGSLSKNITAVHLGFSNFVDGSPSENLTAVDLAFSNFMQGGLFENLAAVHLGFFNFMQGGFFENLTAVHLGFSNITHGCRSCRHDVKLPQSCGKCMHLQRNITHECLLYQSMFNGEIIFQETEKIVLLQVKALIKIIVTSSGLKKICALFYHPPVIL